MAVESTLDNDVRQLYVTETNTKADLFRLKGLIEVPSICDYNTVKTAREKMRRKDVKHLAYGLKDNGASENFVSSKLVKVLQQRGVPLSIVRAGVMQVRTAGLTENKPPTLQRHLVKLTIWLSKTYWYTSMFTIFNLDTYDFVLGKPFVRHINLRHSCDHVKNWLWIWKKCDASKKDCVTQVPARHWLIKGLPPHVTQVSMDKKRTRKEALEVGIELMFAEDVELTEEEKRKSLLIYIRSIDEGTTEDTSIKKPATQMPLNAMGTKFVKEFDNLFGQPTGLPPDKRKKFRIDLKPGSVPRFQGAYRTSQREDAKLRKQLTKAIEHDWLDLSSSEFASPVLFVPKKNGEYRMCIDY